MFVQGRRQRGRPVVMPPYSLPPPLIFCVAKRKKGKKGAKKKVFQKTNIMHKI